MWSFSSGQYLDGIEHEKNEEKAWGGKAACRWSSLYLGAFEVSWQHLGDGLHCRKSIVVVLLWVCSYISCVLCLYDAFRLLKMRKVCKAWTTVLNSWTPWSLLNRCLLCSWNITHFVHPSGAIFTSHNQPFEIEHCLDSFWVRCLI